MFLKSALVVAALVAVELAAYVYAAGAVNPLLVTLVVVALSVFGGRHLVITAPGLVARTAQDVSDGLTGTSRRRPDEAALADRALELVAGLLLVFPGLLTGAAGLLLLVGPVRGVVASLLGTRLAAVMPTWVSSDSGFARRYTGVVDVTSTVKDPAPTSRSANRDGQTPSRELPPTHGTTH